jgi:beta-lactamase regulating signal transducer with metallopeptidase domain
MERQFLSSDLLHDRDSTNRATSPASLWTEIAASQASTESYRSPGSFSDGLIPILWGLSISLLVLLMVRRLMYRKANSLEEKALDHSQSTPCARCRYFNKNPYIKCAVNPAVVQKVDANDCSDFSPATIN